MTAAAINPALAAALSPPVMEARRWVEGRRFPENRPLLNLSQAAPVDPPPEALRRAIAEAALERPEAHLYGPVLGDPALRAEIASRWSTDYDGDVTAEDVAVTSGCNQAFCAALATLAGPGDAVLLPTPWYFNHRMWLDMAGVETTPLPCGEDGLPDPAEAARRIGPRIRALVLVTPNNPTGAEYPPALIGALADLCAERGIALVIDETYRDFRAAEGPAHGLFARPDWRETVVQLYSFSKAFRLTGHRIGALVAGPERLAQAEKFLDTVTICPSRLGQVAALEGLRSLAGWVAAERREMLARRRALERGFAAGVGGWRLLSCGAYFAYVALPFEAESDAVAKALVDAQSMLTLPGTMFAPRRSEGGDGLAERTLRIAFANADEAGIGEMLARLRAFSM